MIYKKRREKGKMSLEHVLQWRKLGQGGEEQKKEGQRYIGS